MLCGALLNSFPCASCGASACQYPGEGEGSDLAGEGRGLGEEVARLHWEGQVLAKDQGALQGEEQCFKRDRAAGLLWRLRSCGEGVWAFCAGLLGSIGASTGFLRRI